MQKDEDAMWGLLKYKTNMNILKERGFEMNLYLKLEYGCKGGMMGATKFKVEIQRRKIQALQKWPK